MQFPDKILMEILGMHDFRPKNRYPSCKVYSSDSRVDPLFSVAYMSKKSGHDLYSLFNFSKSFTTIDILARINIRRLRALALYFLLLLCDIG